MTIMHTPSLFREVLRLLRPFLPFALAATALGSLGGLATAWLLATINQGLSSAEGVTLPLLARFAGLCLLSIAGGAIAGAANAAIGQQVIAALRKDISARILQAPLAAIERRRAYRLQAVLTSDVDTVSAFTFNVSGYAVAAAVVLGSLVYLFFLSLPVALLVLAVGAAGVAVNIHARRRWIRDYEAVRAATDDLHKQYRAITDGAKELRLSRDRRRRVHGLLLSGAADRIAMLKSRAMRLYWIADATGSALFFAAIGLLLGARHLWQLDPAVLTGTILVLLNVKGPVEQIAAGLPLLGQAQVAFRRIATLAADFAEPEAASTATPAPPLAQSIELREASHAFPDADGRPGFVLGPLNLTVRRGETLFIVGGNGSGKTTLIKLLLGLYRPQSGQLLLDGAPVGELDDYRQLFSAVFSDYFLFDDLVADDPALAEQAGHYLQRLEIAHKVRVERGRLSTTDLSSGQRKRVALVHAYLEQRPVLMCDEWAADQDPAFRRVFYAELLPELKRQGKTLIIVSHDDRYFSAADRLIRLEDGRIVEDRMLTADDAASEAP